MIRQNRGQPHPPPDSDGPAPDVKFTSKLLLSLLLPAANVLMRLKFENIKSSWGLNFSNSNSNKRKERGDRELGDQRRRERKKTSHTRKPVTEIAHVDVKQKRLLEARLLPFGSIHSTIVHFHSAVIYLTFRLQG